ncbi:hypothetical protein JCM11491_002681 [Sporobolomyces phaffii]
MAPLEPSHFSSSFTGSGSGPVPYTPLAADSDDPLTADNPYAPSPSYTDTKMIPRANPLNVDGSPRTQLEFYQAELNFLRTENATLRDQNQKLKDRELEQLRDELKSKKDDRDCTKIFTLVFAVIAVFIVFCIALARFV